MPNPSDCISCRQHARSRPQRSALRRLHSEEQARKYGITVPADAPTATTRGVSGSGTSKIVNVGRIKLGPIDRANLDVYVRNGSNTDVELPLLGQPFWQDYQYTIDMQTKQVHFVRR